MLQASNLAIPILPSLERILSTGEQSSESTLPKTMCTFIHDNDEISVESIDRIDIDSFNL